MAGNKAFGKHLQKLREMRGFSQEELAENVGVEYQTISRIETGLYFTSYDNLQKIAQALNLTIRDLFDFCEEELSKPDLLKLIISDLTDLDLNDLKIIRKMINLFLFNKNK